MGREIILLHFGQAGVQMGSALWELFCIEHGLSAEGHSLYPTGSNYLHGISEYISSLFHEGQRAFTPRAMMVDLEPTVIDEVRTGPYRRLWRPTCLVTGKEDAANNFGRGNCTVGKLKLDETMEMIRKLVEEAHNLAAFQTIHSHSGGTGSGLTSLVIDQLCDEYGKKFKFGTSVFPSPMYSQSTVDPYNAMLHSHTTIDTLDCEILIDNQTMFERCTKNLSIAHPSFTEINRLLAQMLSSIFLSHRFFYHGSQHADTTELLTNLIPYPRIHFPALFFAPIVPQSQMDHDSMTVQELTRTVFSEDAQTLDFPCKRNAYISCAMLYRGVSSPKYVYDALHLVKGTPSIGASFVDWCPTGFKIGLNSFPPTVFPGAPLAESSRSVCMLAGNLGMREAWRRNNMKFDVLFSRRSFVHWFIGEGVEESEFIESREDMAYLEQDYAELMSETMTGREMLGPPSDPVMQSRPGDVHSNQSSHKMDEMVYPPRQSNNANLVPTGSGQHNLRSPNQRYGDDKYAEWIAPSTTAHSSSVSHASVGYPTRYTSRPPMNPQGSHARQQYSRSSWNSEMGDEWSGSRFYRVSSDKTANAATMQSYSGNSGNEYPPQARPRRRMEEFASDNIPSMAVTTNDSRMHTSEISRHSIPRGVNMNFPRNSQAHTDTTFLPSETLVRIDRSSASGTGSHYVDIESTNYASTREWKAHTPHSDPGKLSRYHPRSYLHQTHLRKERSVPRPGPSSTWSIASAVSYFGRDNIDRERMLDDVDRLTESEPFAPHMEEDSTDMSGTIECKPSEADSQQQVANNLESSSSGIASVSQIEAMIPFKPPPCESLAHPLEHTRFQRDSNSLTRLQNQSHHHHHHHHRHHHHHHGHTSQNAQHRAHNHSYHHQIHQHRHPRKQRERHHSYEPDRIGTGLTNSEKISSLQPTGDILDSGLGHSNQSHATVGSNGAGDRQLSTSASSMRSASVTRPVYEVSISDADDDIYGKKHHSNDLLLTPVLSQQTSVSINDAC